MYTANTMASAAEALGMTLPGSSSFPAESPEKLAECDSVGATIHNLLEKNILPRDIMTRSAFENAMVRAFDSPQYTVQCFTVIILFCS
jgi:dihydroxy-acid dehydratase